MTDEERVDLVAFHREFIEFRDSRLERDRQTDNRRWQVIIAFGAMAVTVIYFGGQLVERINNLEEINAGRVNYEQRLTRTEVAIEEIRRGIQRIEGHLSRIDDRTYRAPDEVP